MMVGEYCFRAVGYSSLIELGKSSPLLRRDRQGGRVGHISVSAPYFPWDLTARLWSTGITVTANGVPASSPTMGSAPGWLPPSIEFS
jgi:hypothetical protein